jgi:hypothetical protein
MIEHYTQKMIEAVVIIEFVITNYLSCVAGPHRNIKDE